MPPKNHQLNDKFVQLHCPSTGETIEHFQISAGETAAQTLIAIRAAFNMPSAEVYTARAQPVLNNDANKIANGQRLLVAANAFEKVHPEAPPERSSIVLLLLPSTLSSVQKRTNIQQTRKAASPSASAYITMEPYEVEKLVQDVLKMKDDQLNVAYPVNECIQIMKDNWGVQLAAFIPISTTLGVVRPVGQPQTWNQRMLALMAILSDFTQGSGPYMGELLRSSVEVRKVHCPEMKDTEAKLQMMDVHRTITDLLFPIKRDFPDSIKTEDPKLRAKKNKQNQRKKDQRNRKKQEKKDREAAAQAEALGGGGDADGGVAESKNSDSDFME